MEDIEKSIKEYFERCKTIKEVIEERGKLIEYITSVAVDRYETIVKQEEF